MTTIDKDVPMPERKTGKYPIAAMQVGDSFLITNATMSSVRSGAYKAAKLCGFKVSIRMVEGGIRVWRIK